MKRFVLTAALLLSLICASAQAEFKLPPSLTTIGDGAFQNVPMGDSLRIPGKVKSIGADAFAGAGLKQIELPESVKSIAASAFDSATSFLVKSGSYAQQWCKDHGYTVDSADAGAVELSEYIFMDGEVAAKTLHIDWQQDRDYASVDPYWGQFNNGKVSMWCGSLLHRRNFPGGITNIELNSDPDKEYSLFGVSLTMSSAAAFKALQSQGWDGPSYPGRNQVTAVFTKSDKGGNKDNLYVSIENNAVRSIEYSSHELAPKCRALLIGVEQFKNEKVHRFINDVALLKDALSDVNDGRIEINTLPDPEKPEDIRNACNALFSDNTDEDVSIVFISTHGKLPTAEKLESELSEDEKSGRVYIEYGDMALKNSALFTPLELAGYLRPIKGIKIVILGSCFSGGAITGNYSTAFKKAGVLVIAATAPNEVSAGTLLDLWGSNPFAKTVGEALEKMNADVNPKDGTITLGELFDYLHTYVPTRWTLGIAPKLLVFSTPTTNMQKSEYHLPLFWNYYLWS